MHLPHYLERQLPPAVPPDVGGEVGLTTPQYSTYFLMQLKLSRCCWKQSNQT